MANKRLLQQMLEHLVNEESEKAEDLFHEYIVIKSREVYESLIESELENEEDEEVDEAFGDDDMDDMGDDDMGGMGDDDMDDMGDDDMDDVMGGDATDDLNNELGDEFGEEGESDSEELFQDLTSIVDELQARFDELQGGDMSPGIDDGMGDDMDDMDGMDDMGDDDMGDDDMDDMGDEFGDEEEMKDDFDLKTVREYVEQVGGKQYNQFGKMGDNGVNTKSVVAGKNNMGGTTANILSGRNGATGTEANKGQLKGSGLLKGTPKVDNAGNINVPGAKNGKAFNKKEPGHGAEKAGAKESAESKQSLFRGRR
jgi:hypothetical protein